ncbi:MAG: phosphate ABC transporter permease subunit PstC [Bacillota bacterium]
MQKKYNLKEKLIKYFFMLNGLLVIFVLLSIFFLLISKSLPAFSRIGILKFFTSAKWNPGAYSEPTYGILAQVASTLMVTVGAMIISVPIGIGTAAYLAEIANPKVKMFLKPIIEILAGIPSVVIGFLGIVLLGPLIADTANLSNGLNAINGSILLAIMSLPTIISLSEDAISAVPDSFRQASLGLGANRWQTLVRSIIPSSLSGIIASIMLGMGRAIGETMTVLMATGNAPALSGSFFDSVRTMTATIAIELGEVPYNTTHYYSLFAVGLILFLMTFVVNLISDIILHKYQEVG